MSECKNMKSAHFDPKLVYSNLARILARLITKLGKRILYSLHTVGSMYLLFDILLDLLRSSAISAPKLAYFTDFGCVEIITAWLKLTGSHNSLQKASKSFHVYIINSSHHLILFFNHLYCCTRQRETYIG